MKITHESLTKDLLVFLYCDLKQSLEDIAIDNYCSKQWIYKLLKLYNVPRRNRSEARQEAIKKHKFPRFIDYDINGSIFDTWSPGMAWVLGVIFTDGCLYRGKGNNGTRVTIDSVDIELLKKINRVLRYSKPIIEARQSYDKTRHIFKIDIHIKKIIDRLQVLGLTPRKSLTMQFPLMPQKYHRHFIRGCWDGDGSIVVGKGQTRASYVTGSKSFIEKLVLILFDAGIGKVCRDGFKPIIPATIFVNNRGKNPSYSIKINAYSALSALYRFMYEGVDSSMYLSRKHDKLAGILYEGY